MKFLPIHRDEILNQEFTGNPECIGILSVFKDLYAKVGFDKPWIGYFASFDNREIVGIAGFKGKPKDGKVEIAYGTFKNYQQRGIGTQLCRELVSLSLQSNSNVMITARTLPENNASTRILTKNGFEFVGMIRDEDDGDVWEWKYRPND